MRLKINYAYYETGASCARLEKQSLVIIIFNFYSDRGQADIKALTFLFPASSPGRGGY